MKWSAKRQSPKHAGAYAWNGNSDKIAVNFAGGKYFRNSDHTNALNEHVFFNALFGAKAAQLLALHDSHAIVENLIMLPRDVWHSVSKLT